jgi:uncharacterized protein
MRYIIFTLCLIFLFSCQKTTQNPPKIVEKTPETLLLKDYRPKSIYNVPVTFVAKARYPAIDMHSHPDAKSLEELDQWVKTMDAKGIEKSIIMTYETGARFDSLVKVYGRYLGRFDVYCGFDYTGYDKPGFGPAAVRELERCVKAGAKGVGELGDKGNGEFYSKPIAAWGMHVDDPRMSPLYEKCAELRLPVSIHVGEPLWFYEKPDSTNDGLMNTWTWLIKRDSATLEFEPIVRTLENAVKQHPRTTFIACHLANCNHDLSMLGAMFDKYPNLYADIGARLSEIAPVPRATRNFFERYANRIVYGTDMGMEADMYEVTFRILETNDEHFYDHKHFDYHWPLNGLGLSDATLKKVYRENALRFLKK